MPATRASPAAVQEKQQACIYSGPNTLGCVGGGGGRCRPGRTEKDSPRCASPWGSGARLEQERKSDGQGAGPSLGGAGDSELDLLRQ